MSVHNFFFGKNSFNLEVGKNEFIISAGFYGTNYYISGGDEISIFKDYPFYNPFMWIIDNSKLKSNSKKVKIIY